MSDSGPLQGPFFDRKTGASDLSVTGKLLGRGNKIQLEYERENGTVNAITLTLRKRRTNDTIFTLVREVTGFVAKQFVFIEEVEIAAGEQVEFVTSGAGAAEDHSAKLFLQEA